MTAAPSIPLYQWLANTLREQISRGDYRPGDLLPTEHQMMSKFRLSSTTVRRAMRELEQGGWIFRKAGKGTFVRRPPLEENLLRLTSFAEEMQRLNLRPNYRLLCAKPAHPPDEVARGLDIEPGEQVFLIERLQLADQEVIALAIGYWRMQVGELLAAFDLSSLPLYEILEDRLNIYLQEADEVISALAATPTIAKKMGVRTGQPLLVRERISYTSEMQPVEYTSTYYRNDRYQYKVRLLRRMA
jgi:GntR family transcriptional regulator